MKKYINYIIAVIFFVIFLCNAGSSYILWFVLPRGVGTHGSPFCQLQGHGPCGNYWTVFGWTRYMWVDIHSWISVAIATVIVIHLVLHWRWIVETTKRVKSYITKHTTSVAERYITNVILLVLFLFQALSGYVLWLAVPRGRLDYYNMLHGAGRTFWGLQRNVWLDLHSWVAVAMVSVVIIHVILHWRWIVSITSRIVSMIIGKRRLRMIEEPKAGGVSRREFLKGAGLAVAGAAVVGAVVAALLLSASKGEGVGATKNACPYKPTCSGCRRRGSEGTSDLMAVNPGCWCASKVGNEIQEGQDLPEHCALPLRRCQRQAC